MSYTALEEIPFNIRRCYDTDDLMVWMTKYNEFYTKIKAGEIEVPDYCSNDAMYARELAFDTCKYLPSSRFVEASSTVEVLDRQNEVADIESYYDGSKEFIDFGGIGIQQHSSKVISTIWKAYKGIDEATGQPAIFTCENYFRGKKMYDDAWYAVLNGGLSEKSIGSRIDPAKTKTECDENGCHNRVYADQWFELSSVFRGANPRTYIIDKHEALKSFGNVHIVAINDRYKMCPVKEKYLSFKSDVADVDPTARVHYLDDGLMYISGSNGEMYKQIISQHYPDAQTVKGSIENVGNFTFIIDRNKGEYTDLDVFDELMRQVEGEREAIDGYTASMKYLDTTDLKPEVKESLKKILDEIISDEQRHIGTLEKAIAILSEEFHVNFEEGEDEAKEIAEKGDETGGACPEGQHQHAGVSGCHDIMREHPELTSGHNSVHYLASMPDSKLRDLLVSMTSLIREYPREQIETFLSTPAGKKYIIMYMEYQRRKKASDYTESMKMSEKVEETALKEDAVVDINDADESKQEDLKEAIPEARPDASDPTDDSANSGPITEEVPATSDPTPESPKEAIPDEGLKSDADLPTAMANISSMLVALNSKIETMCARLDGLENMTKMQMDTKDTLTNEVMEEVAEVPEEAPVAEEEKVEEISPEVPPAKEEGADEEKDEASDDGKAEEAPAEDKPGEESKPEDKPAEGESESKDEPKGESEDKPEDKPEEKSEDKSEDKKTSEETEKKPDIKEKSAEDWDDISALTKRINQLKSVGVSVEGFNGGTSQSITSGNIKLASFGGVSLVDTPAPAPYTPASESYKEAGGSMFDQIVNAMDMPAKQFNESIRKGVFNS